MEMSPDLEGSGVSFPSFERGKPYAHHWLADALKGPHVYKKAQGNITRMVDLVKESKPHTVCFSSEDFETYLRRPRAINRLLEVSTLMDARPVFVIYVRNQVEYLESLYLQFLRMGLKLDASKVIDEVIATGQFKWRKWVIQFDYLEMLETLAKTNCEIVLRNYHDLKNNCIIQDFLSCIGQPADLKPDTVSQRLNSARLNRNLSRFAQNCGMDLDPRVLSEIDGLMDGLRPRLSSEAQHMLRDRFWPGNQNIETRYGLELNQGFDRPPAHEPVPVIDEIFKSETLDFISNYQGIDSRSIVETSSIQCPEKWFATV